MFFHGVQPELRKKTIHIEISFFKIKIPEKPVGINNQ